MCGYPGNHKAPATDKVTSGGVIQYYGCVWAYPKARSKGFAANQKMAFVEDLGRNGVSGNRRTCGRVGLSAFTKNGQPAVDGWGWSGVAKKKKNVGHDP